MSGDQLRSAAALYGHLRREKNTFLYGTNKVYITNLKGDYYYGRDDYYDGSYY